MPINVARSRDLLKAGDFRRLFIDELGWDRHDAAVTVQVDGRTFTLHGQAHKRGMAAFVCPLTDTASTIPDYALRRKIERQVAKSAHEHIIIFTDQPAGAAGSGAPTTQIWQWVRREPGKPAACREHAVYPGHAGDALIQKLQPLAFAIGEEEKLTLPDVTNRARKGFDIERVTKRFYERFKDEHKAFLKFIDGIQSVADRQWYASIMLNRLMFVYFIQRKGFLDGDHDYLRNRMRRVQQQRGKDKFLSFYRYFLIRLMHEGLGKSKEQRKLDQAFAALLGTVPYLNGGIFEQHQLEANHPDIDIPDKAFEAIFDFFDEYQWHLDERPLRSDKEINPDVLGYIFEKYINQKQMGAYYTKEDITEYIGKNTVLPVIFDKARDDPKHGCPVAFKPASAMWRLLSDDPDRYIYPAMRHGVIQPPLPLGEGRGEGVGENQVLPLPPDIEAGIADVSKRGGWNKPAPAPYALPTETWREHVARRQRCLDLRRKLAAGEITAINDFITLNLDIRQFAQDVVETCEGPELLRALYHAISTVTILDPTCGSGAFLFAALNILEPLYEACLDRMERFITDSDSLSLLRERAGVRVEPTTAKALTKAQSAAYDDFRRILAEVATHPNERYFIFKSIILSNLFGVDIMEEATEICRLRLFLKLVAQVEPDPAKPNLGVEPLPDIDFNIRAGNTLVGFASVEAIQKSQETSDAVGVLGADREIDEIVTQAASIDRMFAIFRKSQTATKLDSAQLATSKKALRDAIGKLNDRLNRFLAGGVYRVFGNKAFDTKKFDAWRIGHQPFHWITEFYGIVRQGGFDAIIGNPPYVELKEVRSYQLVGYRCESAGNLYAVMIERAFALQSFLGRMGFIVPVSSVSTDRYEPLQKMLSTRIVHYSSFDDRPSRLFDGLEHIRLTIHLIGQVSDAFRLRSTRYNKWNADERAQLFQVLEYAPASPVLVTGTMPKLSSPVESQIVLKLQAQKTSLSDFYAKSGKHPVLYSRKVGYFLQVLDFMPEVRDGKGKLRPPSEFKEVVFGNSRLAKCALACLNANLCYWFVTIFSDCRHLNKREVDAFPINLQYLLESQWGLQLINLASNLMKDIDAHSEHRKMTFKHDSLTVQCIFPKRCKPIIDEIDTVLAKHYGFTAEELDFIINYDIKYRLGAEASDGDDE